MHNLLQMSYLPLIYSSHCPLPGEQIKVCLLDKEAIHVAIKCYQGLLPFALSFVSLTKYPFSSVVCPLVKIKALEEISENEVHVLVEGIEFARVSTALKKHSQFLYPVVKHISRVSLGEQGVKNIEPEYLDWMSQSKEAINTTLPELIDVWPILQKLELSAKDRWQLINEDNPDVFERKLKWHLVLSTYVKRQIKNLGKRIDEN